MKLHGGYNVLLAGRPAGEVELLPEPDVLYLPLRSRRFTFSDLRVQEGEHVRPGHILAKDPDNYSLPMLAPRGGMVRLSEDGHIVLEGVVQEEEEPYDPRQDAPHVPNEMGSVGMKRYKMLTLGAWQFLYDAHDQSLPDPFGTPRAVIVSTLNLEPFAARGDVQLHKRLTSFVRGLEHVQSLLEYQPIYLVLPDIRSDFARQVRETIRGYAWAKLVQVPLRYPFDNFAVLARTLGLNQSPGEPVWAMRAEGVLAIDRALTLSRSCTVRIISLAGPAVDAPGHLKAMPGYSLRAILDGRISDGSVRVISGGVLTGETLGQEQLGLDVEATGLTLLAEHTDREMLSFARPGWARRSHSRCFLSLLRGGFQERLTTALRGERRPCVACGACEDVCPVRIMPHLIHKLLYKDALEDVERARVDLCVACGLCSFVCPSKIELAEQFVQAKETILQELHAEEVQT